MCDIIRRQWHLLRMNPLISKCVASKLLSPGMDTVRAVDSLGSGKIYVYSKIRTNNPTEIQTYLCYIPMRKKILFRLLS